MKLSCVLVALALPCVLGRITMRDMDMQDLRRYAREVIRLFDAIPGWSEDDSDSSEVSPLEVVPLWRRMSAQDGPVSGQHSPHENPTITLRNSAVDEGAPSSAEDNPVGHSSDSVEIPFTVLPSSGSDESSECLRDRDHVAVIFQECIYKQMDSTDPEKNASLPEGSTARFLKYCKKTPQLRGCIRNMIIRRLEGCLDEGMNETIANVEEVTKSIIRFICNREADRVSVFITDGGVECWRRVTSSRVLLCLNANLANHVLNSLFDLPSLTMVVDKCLHLELAEKCVQKELELCRERMSGPLVSVLFGIAREMASCDSLTAQGGQPTTGTYVGTHGTTSTAAPDSMQEPNLPSTLQQSSQELSNLRTNVTSPNSGNTTNTTASLIQPDGIIIAVVIGALIIAPALVLLARILKIRTQTQSSRT